MSKKAMMIVVGVMSVLSVALVVLAVLTDHSPTWMGICGVDSSLYVNEYEVDGADKCQPAHWQQSDIPLHVRIESRGSVASSIVDAVASSIGAINDDVGFQLFQVTDGAAHVVVQVGVPVDRGWRDPGGDARLRMAGGYFSRCDVAIANVPNVVAAESVARHELYHCVGLAHDAHDEGSIMRPVQEAEEELALRPRLRDADRRAIRAAYR
jgi:hypothetical protein